MSLLAERVLNFGERKKKISIDRDLFKLLIKQFLLMTEDDDIDATDDSVVKQDQEEIRVKTQYSPSP